METHLEKINPTTVKLRVKISNREMMPPFLEGLNKANIVLGNHSKDKPKLATPSVEAPNPFVLYVRRDVCDTMMKAMFPLAAQQCQVVPVSKPEFESELWKENTDFIFSATFEVQPEIKSINLTSLKIRPESILVTEDMIEKSINNLRRTQQIVTEDQHCEIAAPGCVALIDIDAYKGNVLFQPACVRDQIIEISRNKNLTPIEKCLMGMRRFDERTFEFTAPLDSPRMAMAGQNLLFHVKLKGFKVVRLPELNDDFVASCFQGASLEVLGVKDVPKTVPELKDYFRTEIEYRQRLQYFKMEKLSILNQLVNQNPIEIPQALVESQYQALVAFERSKVIKLSPNKNLDMHLSMVKAALLDRAVRMVRCALIIDYLAKSFQIQWVESDFEIYFDQLAKEQSKKKEFLKRSMNYPHNKIQIAYTILEEKVVRHIMRKFSSRLKVA